MLYDALRFLINIVFGLLVYAVLLRFLMQWLRAPFRNPLGQAVSALTDWAVGFQRLQSERPLPRIGIHYGEALYRDGDYYGRDVNIAARITARSAGGEVLVTRRVDPVGTGYAPDVLLLPDPVGGVLAVRRLEPPFTPAEYARATALVDLVASVGRLGAGSPNQSPAA